ncbi:MAG: hypothetical protein KAY37_03155, partial [Phycisphaerae bacterium]|nr:hypothetical protein [Phycisphaerae bacterium]
MKHLGRPELWLPIALLVLAFLGSRLLLQQSCVQLSERDRGSYGMRPVWQAGFDALSATCGVGLLTYDLDDDYTPLGRWLLAGLGVAGAVLYLAAARQAVGRLWANTYRRLPSIRLILAVFIILPALLIPLVWILEQTLGSGTRFTDTAWNVISAFSSLGWLRGTEGVRGYSIYAVVSLLGAVGWLVWLFPIWGSVWRGSSRRYPLLACCTYLLALLLVAGAIAALEVPRGNQRHGQPEDNRLTAQSAGVRYARGLIQVACASGAGITTEQLTERGVSEGTKLVLAGVVLVGGLGGSAGGGVKWTMLLWALAAVGLIGGYGPGRSRVDRTPSVSAGISPLADARGSADETARRCRRAGSACLGSLLILTLIVAGGLLFIEA